MKRPYSWTMFSPREAKSGQAMTLSWDPRRICGPPQRPDLPNTDDGAGCVQEAVRNDVRRQWPNFGGEPLPPRLRTDPCGPAPEGATRLHIRRLVADHPRAPRTDAQVPSRREEHPGPRLPACAVR